MLKTKGWEVVMFAARGKRSAIKQAREHKLPDAWIVQSFWGGKKSWIVVATNNNEYRIHQDFVQIKTIKKIKQEKKWKKKN